MLDVQTLLGGGGLVAPFDLVQADALDWLSAYPDESASAILTDPPYNIGYPYDGFTDDLPDEDYYVEQLHVLTEAARVLAPGGALLYLHYPEFAAKMFWALAETTGLDPVKLIAWVYHSHVTQRPFRRGTRTWCLWSKGPLGYFDEAELAGEYQDPADKRIARLMEAGRSPRDYDFWPYSQVKNSAREKTAHPCQIPQAMVARLVRLVVPPGGLVLDPYTGSGTTGAACRQTGRRFAGADRSAAYVDIALRRIAQTPERDPSKLTALVLLAEEVKETERVCGGPSKAGRPLFDLAARAVKDGDEATCAFLLRQLAQNIEERQKSGQTRGLSPEFLERFGVYQQFLKQAGDLG